MNDQDLIKRLTEAKPKAVQEFSFDGYECLGKVIRVHDPDTITVIFEYNGNLYKKNLRLNGVDAPELHSTNKKEADLCKAGQKVLADLTLNQIIKIKMGKFDKYGRILSSIFTYDTEIDIIRILIDGGFVRLYDGGKKEVWNIA